MGLRLFRCALNQEDRREDQKPPGYGRKPDVPNEVAEQHEECHQAKAKPPRQAAQPFADTHGFVSR
jgi:hypothetical protein